MSTHFHFKILKNNLFGTWAIFSSYIKSAHPFLPLLEKLPSGWVGGAPRWWGCLLAVDCWSYWAALCSLGLSSSWSPRPADHSWVSSRLRRVSDLRICTKGKSIFSSLQPEKLVSGWTRDKQGSTALGPFETLQSRREGTSPSTGHLLQIHQEKAWPRPRDRQSGESGKLPGWQAGEQAGRRLLGPTSPVPVSAWGLSPQVTVVPPASSSYPAVFIPSVIIHSSGSPGDHLLLKAPRTSLAVQWLRCHASTAGGQGSIPDQGMPCGIAKKKSIQNCLFLVST